MQLTTHQTAVPTSASCLIAPCASQKGMYLTPFSATHLAFIRDPIAIGHLMRPLAPKRTCQRTLQEIADEQRNEIRRGVAPHEHVRVHGLAGVPSGYLRRAFSGALRMRARGGRTAMALSRITTADAEMLEITTRTYRLKRTSVKYTHMARQGFTRTKSPFASPLGTGMCTRKSCPFGSLMVWFAFAISRMSSRLKSRHKLSSGRK